MSWLGSLIGGATATGVSATLNGVGDAAIKIRQAITGDLPADKRAEIELRLIELDNAISLSQNEVNKIEAGSASLFVAGWRPACGWIGAIGLGYTFIGQPVLSWLSTNFNLLAPPIIDTGALLTLLLGMLGLGGLRTYEKTMGVASRR